MLFDTYMLPRKAQAGYGGLFTGGEISVDFVLPLLVQFFLETHFALFRFAVPENGIEKISRQPQR